MPPHFAPAVWALSLASLGQLLPCGGSPTEDYQRFASHVAKQDCKAVYQDLDAGSQARLDALLKSLVDLALESHEQAENQKRRARADATQTHGVAPDAGVAVEASAPDGGVTPEAIAEGKTPGRGEQDGVAEGLRKLSGEALFAALCAPNFPRLSTLYRERDLSGFTPIKVKSESIGPEYAEVFASKSKKAAQASHAKLVQEGDRYRVVLEPISVRWRPLDDGRLAPLFESPLLRLGVEVDGTKTPTAAYEAMVAHLRLGQCETFYDGLTEASRAQIEKTLPMMIGFARAMGEHPKLDEKNQDRGKGLLLSMCRQAGTESAAMSALRLGSVQHEESSDNQATLIVRGSATGAESREVVMVREEGQWRLSIDAFAIPAKGASPDAAQPDGAGEP